jgi:2-polyprenyl-6-hydroxyphenyl methylase/3-demethylubiquinone-9 3-methyltransferase
MSDPAHGPAASRTEATGEWNREIRSGERFTFGDNWAAFLRVLDDERIRAAEDSLKAKLELERLDGKRFLDAGSGSGLFSLAARRLGAQVVSFDFDPQSVACTAELKRRYFPDDPHWSVEQGSVLDGEFLSGLGTFDIVYSWGVLHHTGAMWDALERVEHLVAPEGKLFIAIYNDQGRASRIWTRVKKAYVSAPGRLKWLVLAPAFVRLWGPTLVRDTVKGSPLRSWRGYDKGGRGMHPWRDVVDWVGGYPFEVAKPEEIFAFLQARAFELRRLKTCAGGHGCNEYVFVRSGPVKRRNDPVQGTRG